MQKDNTDFNNKCKIVLLILLAVFLWVLYYKNWCCSCCCNNSYIPVTEKNTAVVQKIINEPFLFAYPPSNLEDVFPKIPIEKWNPLYPKIYIDDLWATPWIKLNKKIYNPIFVYPEPTSVNAPSLFYFISKP